MSDQTSRFCRQWGLSELATAVAGGVSHDLATQGGASNIKGTVASGEQVFAKVGGDLNIESLQDTSTFDSKNQSLGVSGAFGLGVSVSGSFSDSKLSIDYTFRLIGERGKVDVKFTLTPEHDPKVQEIELTPAKQ
jgi:hypothetical protein